MTRITNDLADRIAKDLTTHAFGERIEAATGRLERAGMAAYEARYNAAMRKKLAELPAGWVPETKQLHFNVYGADIRVNLRAPVRTTYADNQKYRISVDASNPEGIELAQAAQELDRLTSEQRALREETARAVKRFSTVKGLIKGWPEIEPFARHYAEKAPALPAVIPAELNAKLRLPVAEAA